MPRLRIFDGSILKDVQKLGVFHLGGLRQLRTLKMGNDGLRLVASFIQPLTSVAVPGFVEGHGFGLSPPPTITGYTTATVSGGLGPFTYSWVVTGYTGNIVTALYPNSASTAFSQQVFEATNSADATCFITDSQGNTTSCQVSMTFTHSRFG